MGMSIKFAILGLLNWKPSTGYELKKVFEESSILYWSGNNNQIYKALLELQDEELVTSKTIQQEHSPAKKVYSITEEGVRSLKSWIISPTEALVFKKPFLVQLAWSDLLTDQELSDLLSDYEGEIKRQLIMETEKIRRSQNVPDRSSRECSIWDMIAGNLLSTYQNELNWIQEVREKLFKDYGVDMVGKLEYQIHEVDERRYVEVNSAVEPLCSVEDALDLVALCVENDTKQLMIHYGALSEEFFNLKAKVARDFTQKIINYSIRTAVVIPIELHSKGILRKMSGASNIGSYFKIFENEEEAVNWLLN
jgi:DNA-binding PadR family transcriptional regulator